MSMISGLTERAAIVLAVASRKLMNIHGRLETARKRANPNFTRGDEIWLQPEQSDYTRQRVRMLEEMIDRHRLDALVIFGCSFGTEIKALADRRGNQARLFGADMSQRVIDACNGYNLANTTFSQVDMEDAAAVKALIDKAATHGRVGVYFCETGPYLLPDRMQTFCDTLASVDSVAAVQILEPLYIDWQSRFEIGTLFSYQADHWRHNYPQILKRSGFAIEETDFIPGSMRSNVHRNQPMWLVRAKR
jgi:SAM-dependent methyltransferase